MNVLYFKESLEILSNCCGIISPLTREKATLIENSLILLQSEHKFSEIYFWGSINAIENDYFIAFGYDKDCLMGRRFFYTINCFQWYLLPSSSSSSINSENIKLCLLCDKMLTGNIAHIEHILMDPPNNDVSTIIGSNINNNKNIIHNQSAAVVVPLKEEDRLASLVTMITNESALVPRGSLYKSVDNKIIFNTKFNGLSHMEAIDMTNYQLYREPQQKWNYNLLQRQNYNYPTDFLDTIVDCVIPGADRSYSIQFEKYHDIIYLLSLHYHGMISFHQLNTKLYGFCYFGTGKKNWDLLFML